MKHVHSICYDFITEECSKSGHKVVGVDFEETMKCVGNSFGTLDYINSHDNTILKQMARHWKDLGAGFWPSIAINNRTFRGELNPDNVF